jgi:hypothetical protein
MAGSKRRWLWCGALVAIIGAVVLALGITALIKANDAANAVPAPAVPCVPSPVPEPGPVDDAAVPASLGCGPRITGTWLAKTFTYPSPSDPQDKRAWLLVLGDDGLALWYQSNSYSDAGPGSGFQLTPSMGRWRCNVDRAEIMALDFFVYALESNTTDYPIGAILGLWGDPATDQAPYLLSDGEYDRHAFRVKFSNQQNDRYMNGKVNGRTVSFDKDDNPLKNSFADITFDRSFTNIMMNRVEPSNGHFTGIPLP